MRSAHVVIGVALRQCLGERNQVVTTATSEHCTSQTRPSAAAESTSGRGNRHAPASGAVTECPSPQRVHGGHAGRQRGAYSATANTDM